MNGAEGIFPYLIPWIVFGFWPGVVLYLMFINDFCFNPGKNKALKYKCILIAISGPLFIVTYSIIDLLERRYNWY